jgi:Fe-S-cluster containining protein
VTACAGCGDCCESIVLSISPWEIDALAEETGGEDPIFIRAHWTPTGETRDAAGNPGYEYVCRRLDPETRRCTAHDDRPHVCRGYPWYDDPSPEGKVARAPFLHRRCSHLIDVPAADRPAGSRPLLPLTVV